MAGEPYRRALPVCVALDELQRGPGTQFDPDLMDLTVAELGAPPPQKRCLT